MDIYFVPYYEEENLSGQRPRGFFPRGRFSSDFAKRGL